MSPGAEGRSRRYQDAVETAAGFAAGAQLDAGGIDTFLLREVLRDVEVSLGCGIRCLIGRMSADDNQLGGGLAVEGQGDLVEATLGFVVDADGTLPVALEGDAAEIALTAGGGGGGGAAMVTDVLAVACLPRSSTTLQVTVMAAGSAPAVSRVAVDVLPAIWPAEAE